MTRRPERGGYEKGADTRKTILDTALMEFGESGFTAVTTRQIAASAGVNLPAIKYYFGGKEGLYLACARRSSTTSGVTPRRSPIRPKPSWIAPIAPDQAKALLKLVFGSLGNLLEDSIESQSKLDFLSREMNEPGPAYELLYAQLWRPGVEIVTRLISAAKGARTAAVADRLDALLLLSSLSIVTIGRTVTMRSMGGARCRLKSFRGDGGDRPPDRRVGVTVRAR